MLSFSSKGSAKHDYVSLVQEATRIAKEKAPDLAIDGELQFDAALVPLMTNIFILISPNDILTSLPEKQGPYGHSKLSFDKI